MNGPMKRDIDCALLLEQLDSYISGEATGESRETIEAHLAGCESCAAEHALRVRLRDRLRRAVSAQPGSPLLRERIAADTWKESGAANNARGSSMRWVYAAAATLLLLVGGWGLLRLVGSRSTGGTGMRDGGIAGALSARAVAALQVGAVDHIRCAVEHHMPGSYSVERMIGELGPEYAGLLNIVGDRVRDYEITVAHHCSVGGRTYTHLVLQSGAELISIAITEKLPGENLSMNGDSVQAPAGGLPVCHARLEGYEVAGFETDRFLAFVVSNLESDRNLRIASALAAPVSTFLQHVKT